MPNLACNLTFKTFPSGVGLGEIAPISVSENSGASVESTFFDSIVREFSGSSLHNDWQCSPFDGAMITNNTPLIATLGSNNRLTRITNGVGKVTFQKGDARTEQNYDCTQTDNGTGLGFVDFTEDTVAYYLAEQIKAHVDLDVTKRQLNYFTSINLPSASYVKNANCWARNIDISCLSVGTSHGLDNNYTLQRPGTLITPRHVVVASHYTPASMRYQGRNDYMRFLTPSGVVRTVQVVGASGGVMDRYIDMRVLTLSDDVTGCTPAKVGANWMFQTGSTAGEIYYSGLALNINRNREIGFVPFGKIKEMCFGVSPLFNNYNGVSITNIATMTANIGGENFTDYEYVMDNIDLTIGIGSGDSGGPQLLLVDDEPVLSHCWLTATSGPCSWAGNGVNLIVNQMILEADANAGVSTGYTATQAVNPL